MTVVSSERCYLRGGPKYDIEKDIQALKQKPESERPKPHIISVEEWKKQREAIDKQLAEMVASSAGHPLLNGKDHYASKK